MLTLGFFRRSGGKNPTGGEKVDEVRKTLTDYRTEKVRSHLLLQGEGRQGCLQGRERFKI